MKKAASLERMALEQDQRLSEVVKRDRFRQRLRERCGFDPAAGESKGQ